MVSPARTFRYTLLFLASALTAPTVWAHAHLTHQYPAADAEVVAAPQALTLNFSEGIEPGFSGATITGPKHEGIKTHPAKRNEQDKKQLIVPLDETLKPGQYTVNWHVVSVDGHKTKGQYTFSVK
ncbi:CopC domain-containing protein YobA [Citrobacter farmeri]|uniref:CopC domain-containing protein YobA n=1 Tax=Citrobacter farmeri TaxID=67824 RepID=UPI00189AD6E1|nr:CopC domain-containing protein YobA [Citrobacter farmeri]MBU5646040.1 CopC domain-containing protein YobA [Pluralibacter sp. S54_ASV_43]HAT3754884.1 CopC domain-containing protein YobA [Citrobacter amalonaticus]HAU5704602.1 CopC domain-containing protein YobA [Citrobacter freundii]EHK0946771.1 CopC domain-containing protein YobA [Citrobacter farmeri]EKX4542064.1 CopC domain-containing protein YobA [Citrobacter farmeri]